MHFEREYRNGFDVSGRHDQSVDGLLHEYLTGPAFIGTDYYKVGRNYGLHLPLHRQSDVYQREGVDLDVSTLGAVCRSNPYAAG